MFGLLYELDIGIANQILDEAVKPKVAEVAEYNKDKTTTYRELRPDDFIMGGTELTYSASYASGAAVQRLFGATNSAIVPQGTGVVILGWYCNAYLGEDGYFTIKINTIKRHETQAVWVYNQRRPPHFLLEPQQPVFGRQGDLMQIYLRQQTGAAIVANIVPFGFMIGGANQLVVQS